MKEGKATKGTKAFLISRVSDSSQREALPAQELRLNKYATEHEYDATPFSFDETAYKEDRAKFVSIIDMVFEYDGFCIMVFDKIDRLTRDCSSTVVQQLKSIIKTGKIELHFPSDNLIIHKDSPAADKARLDMGMVFGGYYSASIGDNVKRRQEEKLAKGEYPRKAPIGYININLDTFNARTKIPHKDIIPDPIRAPFIKKIFELRLEGQSYRAIAKHMKEEGLTANTPRQKPINQSGIEIIVRNRFYYGEMWWDGRYHPHRYEPLISKQLFDKVQLVNKVRAVDHPKVDTKQHYTFNNVLKCGKCGCSISSYVKKGHTYMQCSKAKGNCGQQHTSEAAVIPQITKLLSNIQPSESDIKQIMDALKKKHDDQQLFYANNIEQTRADYKKLKDRLPEMYLDKLDGRITPDEYDTYVARDKAAMEKLDERLVNLTNNDKSFMVTSSYLLKLANIAPDLFKSSKPRLKNKLLKILLSNLKLDQKRLYFTVVEPFGAFINCRKSSNWLLGLDSNQ